MFLVWRCGKRRCSCKRNKAHLESPFCLPFETRNIFVFVLDWQQ